MKALLAKKKEMRVQFLNKLYEITDGNALSVANNQKVGRDLVFSYEEIENITEYLKGAGLIKHITMGQGIKYGRDIQITYLGIREIEEAILDPNKVAEHFSPVVNILNVNSMQNSQIQQNNTGSTQNQENHSTKDLKDIFQDLLKKIGESQASNEQKELAESYVDIIMNQVKFPKEKRDSSLVERSWDKLNKLCTLISLGDFATKVGPLISQIFS